MEVKLEVVKVDVPEGVNVILGQSHFIKTVEDLGNKAHAQASQEVDVNRAVVKKESNMSVISTNHQHINAKC